MISQSTVVRNAPQQDLMNELHVFVRNISKVDQGNVVDLTKTALTLLKSLPATRSAIFEYFSQVFTNAAAKYIEGIENEIKTGEIPIHCELDEAILSEIHTVLVTLINEVPTSWAPIISTWSLDLLGEISTKYAGKAHITPGVLNETLQLWMACRATRTLVDVNTKCISSLINSNTEACISALLDTSVKHSPNFDWVVAHVGSCFPNTVITRVLSCGLKDFYKNKSYEQGCDSPKLKSVVGILGHLAGSHSDDIRNAIVEMFIWSLKQSKEDDNSVKLQKKATIPFILQLAYLSSTLLSSICTDLKKILNINTVEDMSRFLDDWCKYFGSSENLENLITTLILRSPTGGFQTIYLILECILSDQMISNEEMKLSIKEKCKEMLETIMSEIDLSLRNKYELKILESFGKEINEIHKMLISSNEVLAFTAARIVIFLSCTDITYLMNAVIFLLQNANTPDHLALLLKILTNELIDKTAQPFAEKGGHLSVVIERILSRDIQKFFSSNEETIDLSQMWENLLTLLKWEKTEKIVMLNSKIISKAIYSNLESISSVFSSEVLHMHVVADILDTLEIPIYTGSSAPSIQVVMNLTQSTVNYFFACCTEEGTALKVHGFKKVNRILKRLCTYSKVARVLALRELLERSLFRSDNVLFGAKNSPVYEDAVSSKLLLKQNKKISKTIPLTKHSSVFNGGIIGRGKRKIIPQTELPESEIAANTTQLISIIKACCTLQEEPEVKYTDLSLESVILVSLLLVQFVSPDVMYNGLPWPEEEFSKVTIERDLFIRKFFKSMPLLWDLLSFTAIYRPALCYCSVLLRALTATLIHQWRSMGQQSKSNGTEDYHSLLDTTVRVIDVMALGQLLPPPLSSVRDVLPHLKCYEIVAILRDCIWCYMRDFIPSPALFTEDSNNVHWRDPTISRPPEVYTNTLRIIMQRNIKTVGHMYSEMFINIPKAD